MELDLVIEQRRALRAIEPIDITDETIIKLAEAAKMSPSCYNNQPWNYIFIKDNEPLTKVKKCLPKGNAWANESSLIIAVFTKKEDDCIVKNREYYLFDTGMSCAFLQLKAVDLGLVIHPIAGFDEKEIKSILNIPEEYLLITLLIVGQNSAKTFELMNDKEKESELNRPKRKDFSEFCYIDRFK